MNGQVSFSETKVERQGSDCLTMCRGGIRDILATDVKDKKITEEVHGWSEGRHAELLL